MNPRLKYPFLFMLGGSFYNIIELTARGYTHWTMYLLGGLCFVLLGFIPRLLPGRPLMVHMLAGGALITLLELAAGLILNIGLGWEVWDYSKRLLNFKGQICLKHTTFWCLITPVAILLNDYLRYWLFGGQKPRYRLL